ncbi:MAG: leucine-rich repeat domain-containing protein, partial [Promethearchaeota archaeon]
MSNDMKVLKDMMKLTEKQFNKRSYLVKNDFSLSYFIEDDSVVHLGLDLEKLNLEEKKFKLVEESIRKLQKLKGFSIRYPKNKNFPEWFKEFKDMEYLSLSNNHLNALPEWIKEFKNLIYLNVVSNDIIILPEWLTTLNELKEFLIRDNYNLEWNDKNLNILKTLHKKNIRVTAPRLFQFIIQHDLSQNKIEIIREIEKENAEKEKQGRYVNPIIMKIEDGDVVEWRMVYYDLKTLPDNFGVFKNLRSLSIVNNPIEYLPNSFGNLTNLKFLDLSGNQLKSLPESFVNLTSITNLNLSNNKFTEIPTVLWALKELTELNLSDNPLNEE